MFNNVTETPRITVLSRTEAGNYGLPSGPGTNLTHAFHGNLSRNLCIMLLKYINKKHQQTRHWTESSFMSSITTEYFTKSSPNVPTNRAAAAKTVVQHPPDWTTMFILTTIFSAVALKDVCLCLWGERGWVDVGCRSVWTLKAIYILWALTPPVSPFFHYFLAIVVQPPHWHSSDKHRYSAAFLPKCRHILFHP